MKKDFPLWQHTENRAHTNTNTNTRDGFMRGDTVSAHCHFNWLRICDKCAFMRSHIRLALSILLSCNAMQTLLTFIKRTAHNNTHTHSHTEKRKQFSSMSFWIIYFVALYEVRFVLSEVLTTVVQCYSI